MRVVALVLLLGPMSCKDFDLVGPSPNIAPSLNINVIAEHDSGSRYTVSAVFLLGSDALGNSRLYSDSSFTIETSVIAPQASPDLSQWFYASQLTRTVVRSQRDSLRMRPPVPQDILHMPSAAIPIAAREDAAEVVLTAGQDLRLHISSVAGDFTTLVGGTDEWQLELRESCSTSEGRVAFSAQGIGAYPTELRVPWEWIANAQPTASHACFRALSRYKWVAGPYSTRALVAIRVSWRIRIVAPSP